MVGSMLRRMELVCAAVLMAMLAGACGAQTGGGDAEFDALLKQGFALHKEARFTEALPLLERARGMRPKDYFANLLTGIDLLRTGRAAEAEPRLELATKLQPAEEIAPGYLGEAEATLGRYAAAVGAYRQALDRSRASAEAVTAWAGFALERFRALGEELRATREGVEAQKRLAAGTERAAENCAGGLAALETREAAHATVEGAYRLSLCYAAEAEHAANRLGMVERDPAGLHRLKGDVLLRLKNDGAGAEAEYRLALGTRPGDPAVLERLAEAQLEAGENDGAQESAVGALKVDPHRREALRTLARLRMNDRDYEGALPFLKQLRQEAPADRGVQVELGRALAQTGADAEARKELAEALKAGYPDEKGALHALLVKVLRRMGQESEAGKAEAEAKKLSDAFQEQGKSHE